MKTFLLMTAIAVAPLSTQAATLLTVDLSTTNQITIATTGAASGATVIGDDTEGFYLANLFNTNAPAALGHTLVTGDLISAGDTSDFSPNLYNISGNLGLNVFSYLGGDTSSFTTGQTAFSGSATWNVSTATYAAMLAGNTGGTIYFAADTDSDIPGATAIGEWANISAVPLPAGMSLMLGAFGLLALKRKRTA